MSERIRTYTISGYDLDEQDNLILKREVPGVEAGQAKFWFAAMLPDHDSVITNLDNPIKLVRSAK